MLPGKTSVLLDSLVVDGVEIKEKHDVARKLNAFFASVDAKLAAKFQKKIAPPAIATGCREQFQFHPFEP